MAFSNVVLGKHEKMMRVDSYLTLYTKANSKCIRDIEIRQNQIKIVLHDEKTQAKIKRHPTE